MRMIWLYLTALSLILGTLGACSKPAPSEDDLAPIYAAVVRQVYEVDHTFGGE